MCISSRLSATYSICSDGDSRDRGLMNCPAVRLMNFISAVFIVFLYYFFVTVHISQPCKSDGISKIFNNFS
jgi:hypothetical protein